MDKRLTTKIFEGNSPVNKYETLVLEQGSHEQTEERMVLAFEAMDELIPNLGIFSRIFTKLRNDFFNAIYSDELTGVAENKGKEEDKEEYIQRLPYFVLVKRVFTDREQLTEELREQLDIVKKRLFDKHKQFEDSQKEIVNLQDQIVQLNQTCDNLNKIIGEKDDEIKKLQQEIEDNGKAAETTQHQLECDITELKGTLSEARQEIQFLSKFKKGYDNMYYAFMDKSDENEDDLQPKDKKSVIATRRAYLIGDIESANHMEEQILTVMNTAVEEYDKFLEDHKHELEEKVPMVTSDMTEAELDLQEMELDEADQELEIMQQRFELTIGLMLSELEMLRKHNAMLMEQLQVLEESKPKEEAKKDGKQTGRTEGKQGESILWAGLEEEDKQEEVADPFIPQERVFSKYAAMVYTSNNSGKTFEEFKDAKYCASCGEKTVICPHKLGGFDKVFILPHNCTHIKITRPKVRINKEIVQSILKPQKTESIFDLGPSVSSILPSFQHEELPEMTITPQTTASQDTSSFSMGEVYTLYTMQRVWEDYQCRTNIHRTIPRPLTLDRAKSLLEQFCAYLVWQDEVADADQGTYSILDMLYNFLRWRYRVDDVMYLAAHDFLTSISDFSSTDKMIQLLGHVLMGNLDASCLRYILLMADFIQLVDWLTVEDFRAFASVVYPFLMEDDLESLQMSYTSFSENHISSQLVYNFIIHIILKYREPRFLDLENKLVPLQSSESSQLTDKEYKEALDNIVPLCSERVRRRLFLEAEKAVAVDGVLNAVPIMRLAQITGYLDLQQITGIIKENLKSRISEWRERPNSTGSPRASSDSVQTMETPTDDRLLTLSKVKTLASNISRMSKHRLERQNQSYEEEEEDEEDWQ